MEEELKAFSEAYFKKDIFVGNRIYLDLRLFFDFTVGNLLHLNQNADKHKYIFNQIEKYILHEEIDLKAIFPKVNTNEDILLENIKKYPNEIIAASPMTLFYEIFKIELAMIQNHVNVLESDKTVILNINTYPLKLDKNVLKCLTMLFQKDIPYIRINFLYRNLKTTKDEKKFREYDTYFVYHFQDLSRNQNILNVFDKFKYIDKNFYIYIPINDQPMKELIRELYFQYFKFIKIIDKNMSMPLSVKGRINGKGRK